MVERGKKKKRWEKSVHGEGFKDDLENNKNASTQLMCTDPSVTAQILVN